MFHNKLPIIRNLFLFSLVILLFNGIAKAQQTTITSFSLQADQPQYQINQEVPVKIMVRSDTDNSNLFVAKLQFPIDGLEVVKIDNGNSFINYWAESSFDNTNGKISIIGGVSDPGYKTDAAGQEALFTTIIFKSKITGSHVVNFTPESEIYRNSDNTNILSSAKEISLSIVNVLPTITLSPTPTPELSPTTPEPTNTPIPKTPTPYYRGDFNQDSQIDLKDLSILMSHFNKTNNFPRGVDLNEDGKVDNLDFQELEKILINNKIAHPKK